MLRWLRHLRQSCGVLPPTFRGFRSRVARAVALLARKKPPLHEDWLIPPVSALLASVNFNSGSLPWPCVKRRRITSCLRLDSLVCGREPQGSEAGEAGEAPALCPGRKHWPGNTQPSRLRTGQRLEAGIMFVQCTEARACSIPGIGQRGCSLQHISAPSNRFTSRHLVASSAVTTLIIVADAKAWTVGCVFV